MVLPDGWVTEDGVRCVVCPTCAFTYDAYHEDTSRPGYYSCPICALAQVERAVNQAISELRGEHYATWASEQAKANGKEPIGCEICYPASGGWPCVSSMVADDLWTALRVLDPPPAASGPKEDDRG